MPTCPIFTGPVTNMGKGMACICYKTLQVYVIFNSKFSCILQTIDCMYSNLSYVCMGTMYQEAMVDY